MNTEGWVIRDATPEDAGRLAEIYRFYVTDSIVTFEIDDVPCEVMGSRVLRVQEAGKPWIVLEVDGVIQGFAYAAPFRDRTAYQYSVETSVYVAHDALGHGYGHAIYGAMLEQLRETDVRVAIALVALPNDASVAVHERLGFRHVGTLTEVGRKFDRWLDVGYWQLTLAD